MQKNRSSRTWIRNRETRKNLFRGNEYEVEVNGLRRVSLVSTQAKSLRRIRYLNDKKIPRARAA